jgi:hypothetical protein
MVLDSNCPPDPSSCIAVATGSATDAAMYGVDLAPGLYYIMIDTWPTPNCIPDFDLEISTAAAGPENDDWADATKIEGDVADIPWTTIGAGHDGWGTYMTSPNVWFCWTAEMDGIATFSLCGSSFDTRIAVYETCDENGAELGVDDDGCAKSLQSELFLPVVAGNEYLIECGGYSSNIGDGVLSVTTDVAGEPPVNDACVDVTPVTLTMNVTTNFAGDNTDATADCPANGLATEAFEAFTLTEQSNVTVEYCGTTPAFELVYIVLTTSCDCEAEPIFASWTDWDACGDGNVTMFFEGLEAGDYYMPILSWHPDYTSYYYEGPYTIDVTPSEYVAHYCDVFGGCDEYIENVTVAEINNTSVCEGYGDFTDQMAFMSLGADYPISISIGNAYSSDAVGVWVDWNGDLDFDDANEEIFLGTGAGPYNEVISVPVDAVAGDTRMRVRLTYSSTPDPCGATSYGEAEDYTISVGGEPSYLTADPTAIDFGIIETNTTGGTTLHLGVDGGERDLDYSIAIEYGAKASVAYTQHYAPELKHNPVEMIGLTPAHDKAADALLFEGFEDGLMPPTGWSLTSLNDFTWEIDTYAPYEGLSNATVLYDEINVDPQDEWLMSPAMDFAGGKYVLNFWWNGSYYWSVDPYDNCNLEVWISLDGGATFALQLFNSDDYGVFTSWQWNNSIVDLTPYKDESNVVIAFRYFGQDGAQFSLDAVSIEGAPLSYLSVDPATGVVPFAGGVDIAVNYDTDEMPDGIYNANLVITHNGATRGTTTIPVTLEVGVITYTYMEPDPMLALYAFEVVPSAGYAYVYPHNMPEGHTTDDMDIFTMAINGTVYPWGWYTDPTIFIFAFDVPDFINSYGLLYDETMQTYTMTGNMISDGTPFSIDFEVAMIGHSSGDVNLDGMVNIGDAVNIINYVFKDGLAPRILALGDTNGDLAVNVGDAVRLVNYVFRGGPAPVHSTLGQ